MLTEFILTAMSHLLKDKFLVNFEVFEKGVHTNIKFIFGLFAIT